MAEEEVLDDVQQQHHVDVDDDQIVVMQGDILSQWNVSCMSVRFADLGKVLLINSESEILFENN